MADTTKNFLQQIVNTAVGKIFGSDYLRDYTHASKTFRQNLYQYAPKNKFLFHTYFSISNEAYDLDLKDTTEQNFGLLVRDIKLPSYTMQTYQMNQYNRKRIVQTKIKYDPVTITFHDDNSNLMATLWAAYYTYYFKDGTNPKVVFGGKRGANSTTDFSAAPNPGEVRGLAGAGSGKAVSPTLVSYYTRNTYEPTITGNGDWGYIGETSRPTNPTGAKAPFFKNITVFGFYQHRFIAYTLINPIITNFAHDTYNYDEGGGVMKNTMTIDYETVVYNEGSLDGEKPGDLVTGFGDIATYDRQLSPLATPGSNRSITGPGGIIETGTNAINDIAKGDSGGILKLGQVIYGARGVNFRAQLKQEVQQGIKNALNSALAGPAAKSRNLQFEFLAAGSTPGVSLTAQSPPAGGTPQGSTQTTNIAPAGGQVSLTPTTPPANSPGGR